MERNSHAARANRALAKAAASKVLRERLFRPDPERKLTEGEKAMRDFIASQWRANDATRFARVLDGCASRGAGNRPGGGNAGLAPRDPLALYPGMSAKTARRRVKRAAAMLEAVR